MKLLLTTIAAVVLATIAFAGPIHDSAANSDLTGVQAELDKGVDVNAKDEFGRTPLHYAATKEIAELLIAKGADVNAKDMPGFTPLHRAARFSRYEIAKLLISKGADVNARDDDGFTPLHEAAYSFTGGRGPIRTVELLISKGADVNAKDIHGMTPLFHAVRNGQKEMAELLLDEGAHVNLIEKRGSTLLHGAAALGHQEIAELLINAGADVNAIDKLRWTPLDWAIRKKSTITADLIRIHGGKTSRVLKELMPRLTYNRELFGFSFTAKGGIDYMVQVTQDFKHWGDLKTINGTGDQVKFIDPRQPLVPFKRNFYRVIVIE